MKTRLLLAITAALLAGLCLPALAQNNGPMTALSLDDGTGYVTAPSGTYFNGDFTIEMWVYARSYGEEHLLDFGNGFPSDNVFLALSESLPGTVYLGIYRGSVGSYLTTSSLFPSNQWVHLAATVSNGIATIYFNGVSQSSGGVESPENVTRNSNFIGHNNVSGQPNANAILDEIRIWSGARTQQQILADMHRSLLGTETGLVSYWRFDEGSGTTSADISGHGETATFQGDAAWVTSSAPVTSGPAQGLFFNSTNCPNVSIPNQASLNTLPLTVMAWVSVPTNEPGGGGGAYVNKYSSGSLNGWQLAQGGQPYGWYYASSSSSCAKIGVGAINDGLWHHLAYVVSSSGDQIYLDGVLKQSGAWAGTPAACTTTDPVTLGVYQGDSCLLGSLDEVSIWNTALTATQIQTYMHRELLGTESGLVAYYRLDEGVGTNTVDATGHGNNGTLEGGAAWINSLAQVGAPQVTTLAATSVAATTATLNASVTPYGQNSIAYFQWGTSITYGNFTATNNVGNGFSAANTSINLTGLTTGTTYHYRAVGTNTGGTNFGADMSFTPGAVPAVTNLAVSSLTSTGAKLNATVNPEGLATTVYFVYGTTTSYGTTNSTSGGSGTSGTAVSDTLSGLTVGVTYHYEVIASNSIGITYGGDQTFTTPTFVSVSAGLTPPIDLYNNMQWGDYNNDGFLDAIWESGIQKNNGNNTFSQVNYGPGRFGPGSIAWGDFSNDGNLDVVITAQNLSDSFFSQLWHNNGNGTFTLVNGTGLPGMSSSSMVVADFDNDGRPDILMMGTIDFNNDKACGIWRNNGNGTFSQISIPGLSGIDGGQAVAADFNNDGYMDFLVTGSDANNYNVTQLWRNNGNGTFTLMTLPSGLSQVYGNSLAVADVNNDGYPDFMISGYTFSGSLVPVTEVFINNGNWTFTQDTQANLPGVWYSAIAFGDYDNDGYPDALLSGATGYNSDTGEPTSPTTQVWRNLGNGSFTNSNVAMQGLYYGGAGWGDFNNDGRLDVMAEGFQANNQVGAYLYENETPVTNTPPTAPTGLQAYPSGTGVTLIWNAAYDTQTPQSGLSYNIRVGSTPGGSDIVSPAANLTNGFRRLAQMGNAQECTFAYVTNLHSGTFYWSVQAIDSAFAGSVFAPEATFTLTNGLPNPPTVTTLAASSVTNTSATLNGTVNPAGLATTFYFQWGPDTNYGNNTPLVNPGTGSSAVGESATITGLNPGETYHYQAVATNIGGISFGADVAFTVPISVPSITGEYAGLGANPPTNVTLNASVDPDGTTTGVWFVYGPTTNYGSATATTILSGSIYGYTGVGVLISNVTEGESVHFQAIATNGSGTTYGPDITFTVPALTIVSSGLPAPPSGEWGASTAWGDFNNDGFLDAALESSLWSNNTGNGTFTQAGISLPIVANSTQTWGDLENTGHLDLLVTGNPGSVGQGSDSQLTQLWHNNGNGTFTLLTNTGLPNVDVAAVAFGDFDNDGKLDILLIGGTSQSDGYYGCISGIWHNNGNGTFSQSFGFGGLYGGGVAVGDFDNDGYLDFVVCGLDSSFGANTELWRNNGDGTFTQISVPGLAGLTHGAVAVGDFNNDGKSDFIISGANVGSNPQTQLWQNNGNWSFSLNPSPLPGLWEGAVEFGDYNNDGNVDLLFSGASGSSFGLPNYPTTQLWENLGNGNFTNSNIGLPALLYNGEAWGDYNNDGRLDILLTGFADINTPQTWLIRNDAPITNTPPTAPTGLIASANSNSVTLSWNASTDAQTPSAGLSYNIRVGTSSGAINIVAPQSDPATGRRRLPQIGNAQQRRFYILTNLSNGTYYWSVQAIDSSFAGSSFAPEAHFSLPGPLAVTGPTGQITSGSAVLNGAVTPNGINTTAWFQWDTNANFTSNTVSVLVNGTNTGPVAVSLLASNLPPLTQYYYRMTASNTAAMSFGSTSNFTTIATVTPIINQISAVPVNAFQLKFTGESGLSYTLHESTNLTNWTVATNLLANTNGMFQFTGTNSSHYPAIYFRLSRP